MRAKEDGLERGVAAGTDCRDIAGGIDVRSEAGGTHQAHRIFAAGDVGVGVGHPADAIGEGATRWAAKHAEAFQILLQASGVDAQSRVILSK